MTEHVPPSTGSRDPSLRALARWSSELHESLASQAASAAQLHQDLEDLRRSMDADPALTTPSQPGLHRAGREPSGLHRSGRHGSRSLLVGAAGVVLALAVAGVAILAAQTRSPASASGPTASATSVTTPATTAATTGAPAGAAPTAARTPGALAGPPLPAWPGRNIAEPPGLPAHGVGADVSGTELTAAISTGQTVDVYERVLMRRGARTLTVRPAASPGLASSLGAPLPVVEDMHAEVRGQPIPVTKTGSGWTLTAPGAATADHLVLRYRLTGALIRHAPAPPGRYMLVLTPLAPSAGGDDAVVVRIQDPRVEEMYCPGGSDPLCGRAEGELHTATVPAGAIPVVVALVTFPS